MNEEDQRNLNSSNGSKNIVIIGNGFDMSLGLKSSYHNFIEYIKTRKRFSKDYELYNYNRLFLRKYENFHLNWSDFESLYEETVRNINSRSKKNKEPQDVFDISSINESIKRLEEDFTEYLTDEYPKWIEQKTIPIGTTEFKKFTEEINPFFKKLIKDENTFFVNFNYTNTMEDLCESVLYDADRIQQSTTEVKAAKERIFHIHGSLEEENILFGGGFTDSEDIINIHYSQSLINDKLFRIKENELLNVTRTKIMSTIDLNLESSNNDLFIIGHSLQGSDFPFLSKLIKTANKVFIFYYQDDYIFKMEEILRKFGSTVAEKIVLVPFLEILLPDSLIISDYKEYEIIDSFLPNKFPREEILSELSLTIDHFSFHNISELKITSRNIEKVLIISKSLVLNKNAYKISRIYFEESIDSLEFNKLINSEYFMTLLQYVNKVIFANTEVDSDFFIQLLSKGNNLAYMRLENCTIVNGNVNEADISICESLKRFEMIDCSYTSSSSDKKDNLFYIKSGQQNNIEKLTILRNTHLIIEREVLENSTNLMELNISITSEGDVYKEELDLKNLEILQADYSFGITPNLRVGNKIVEIILIGFSGEFFRLSSIMKGTEESVGFPKLKVFHLKLPDHMTTCDSLIVDVILDVYSNDTKFIVDKDIKSIKEYYLEYKESHVKIFNHFEELLDIDSFIRFKNLFSEMLDLKNQSIIEEFLTIMHNKLDEFNTMSSIEQDKAQKDSKESEGPHFNNPISTKNETPDTPIRNIIKNYAQGNFIALQELTEILEQQNKAEIVMEVYKDFVNKAKVEKSKSVEEILDLKWNLFSEARNKVIEDFSEKWFVSKEELNLSAIQYDIGNQNIPNISKVIESIDHESYRKKNPELNPIKYTQTMKQEWRKELDEKVGWLNEELK